MGEAKRKSRNKTAVLAGEPVCIYCAEAKPGSLEHMPPIGMFRARQRPSGYEFATCKGCNEGTRGADAVACLMARLEPVTRSAWKRDDIRNFLSAVDQHAPGVRSEIAATPHQDQLIRTEAGLLHPAVSLQLNGPRFTAHMAVFAAKLGMALFREHTGRALPREGLIETQVFLNAGLTQDLADAWLKMLPSSGELKQGVRTSTGQFAYRWNSDERDIVAALAQFHDSLWIGIIASSTPALHGLPTGAPFTRVLRPGELIACLQELG